MRKISAMATVLVFTVLIMAGIAFAQSETGNTFKAGETVYVCGCGTACDCGTISYKAGKCGCGKELVKTAVTRVDKGKVFYMLDGKELSAPAVGKYVCGCGAGCKCGTISQKPGTCGCGKPLKKAD